MRIGISSPITVSEFIPFLDEPSRKQAECIRGLTAPAVDALVRGLLHAGHDVVVFTLDTSVTKPVVLNGDHIRFHIGCYRRNGHLRAATFFHHEIKQLRSFIKQEKLDVLHAHWSYEFAIAGFGCGIPMCITFRDYAPRIWRLNPDFYRFARLLMNRYTISSRGKYQPIANSGYIQGILKKKWGLDSVVIPNPISPDGIAPESSLPQGRSNRKIISISNSWGHLKNIESLLQAFVILRKSIPDAELELVGSVFHRGDPTTESIFRDHPDWTVNVNFRGSVPHQSLAGEIRKCALLVHPSREESFGNIVLEAMGQGVPVIGGKTSGAVPLLLNYGESGVLCDVDDPLCICDAMNRLLTDDGQWLRYSRAGYDWLVSNYTVSKVVAETEKVYQKAMKVDCT